MKFSIITVCFNSAKSIGETIQSVLTQNFTDYEYLVVDGGSTDGTVDLIRAYEPKFGGRLHWTSEPDKGIYDAMNKGISMAKGEFINMLNSDDTLCHGALEAMASAADLHPDADVLYGIIRNMSPDGNEFNLYRNHHSCLKNKTIAHQACFIASAAHRKYGCYDLSYRMAADYDLLTRIIKGGGKFVPVDAVICNYSCSGASWNNDLQTLRETLKIRHRNGFIDRKRKFLIYTKYCILSRLSRWVK